MCEPAASPATLRSMCGFGVIVRTDGGPIPAEWLDVLHDRLRWRGPDGRGVHRMAAPGFTAALVHHRLSIIDPDGGAQPMVLPPRGEADDACAVVFNGCIYNHRALRSELERQGHVFTTDHSDTEVLLHGHRAWGTGLCTRLEGMYAFALVDAGARRVTLARDPHGEKPLYEGRMPLEGGELIVAASDARAVAAILARARGAAAPARRTDGDTWATYLRLGYFTAGDTPWGSAGTPVRAVPVAALPAPDPGAAAPAAARLPDLIEAALTRAVSRRLEADVPLGAFLSGGIDSSLLCCFAVRERPDLSTFCVRMPDPRLDESDAAARVATHLRTRHHTITAQPAPADDLARLIGHLGLPFADSSILPTYWACTAARASVKVALGGDGGDELFAGYDRYRGAAVLARGAPLLRCLPAGIGRRAWPLGPLARIGRMARSARDFPALGVVALESIVPLSALRELVPGASTPPARADALVPHTTRRAGRSPADGLRDLDLAMYLPDDLLRKVDCASMTAGLEARSPYLDRDLAAIIRPLTVRTLTRGGPKGLLRAIAARHLPAAIVRRRKHGFGVPLGDWFRTDFGGLRTVLEDHLRSTDPFPGLPIEPSVARRHLDRHLAGRSEAAALLFALLALSMWARSD